MVVLLVLLLMGIVEKIKFQAEIRTNSLTILWLLILHFPSFIVQVTTLKLKKALCCMKEELTHKSKSGVTEWICLKLRKLLPALKE